MEEKDKKLIITPLNESKKISQVLANDTCRAILDAVSDEPLSATQISEKLNLPLTTVDYNIKKLAEVGLISIHHKKWSPKGKKVNFYAPAEKFIVIAPKLSQAKVMQTLRTLVLPILAILIIAIGLFSYYSYPKYFGAESNAADLKATGAPQFEAVQKVSAPGTATAGNFTNNTTASNTSTNTNPG